MNTATDPYRWPSAAEDSLRDHYTPGRRRRAVPVDAMTFAHHAAELATSVSCFAADGICPVCWQHHYPQIGARHKKEVAS